MTLFAQSPFSSVDTVKAAEAKQCWTMQTFKQEAHALLADRPMLTRGERLNRELDLALVLRRQCLERLGIVSTDWQG